jgi:hypothetical protein
MTTINDLRDQLQDSADRIYKNSKEFSYTENFYNQLESIVKHTEKILKDDEILAITIHLNDGQSISVIGFEYRIPNMLIVHGINELKNQVTIVCHQSNVQLSLQVIKKHQNEPKKVFGFAPIISE